MEGLENSHSSHSSHTPWGQVLHVKLRGGRMARVANLSFTSKIILSIRNEGVKKLTKNL